MGADLQETGVHRLDRKSVTAMRQAIKRGYRKEYLVLGLPATKVPMNRNADPLREAAARQWERLVEDAQYEYGHGGYSGTFAEKSSATIVLLKASPTKRQWDFLTQALTDWRADNPPHRVITVLKKLGVSVATYQDWRRVIDDKWGPALMLVAPDRRWYAAGYCSS